MGKRQRRRNQQVITHAEAAGLALRSEPLDLTEAIRADGTVPIKLISPGWGSKGYYSEEVLKRDGPAAWPAGTHMYFDHPTMSESAERPERSLRDLAAVLESDPKWLDEGQAPNGPGLYSEARVFPQYREAIGAMAPHIGVSIRARGTGQSGTVDGRKGPIVESIDQGLSVDFVTKAGRGGQVLALAEAAGLDLPDLDLEEAGTVGSWFESRIHSDFTCLADDMYGDGRLSRTERIALSNAIGDALDAFTSAVTAKAPQLYDRNRWDDPEDPEDTTTDPLEESAMNLSEADRKQLLAEFRESILDEVRGEVKATHETELKEARDAAAAEKDRADKATGALLIGEAQRATLAEDAVKALPELVQVRIAESITSSPIPTDDAGKLDKVKLAEAVGKLVDAEVTYLEAAGVKVGGGQVKGAGTTSAGKDLTEGAREDGLQVDPAKFQRLGLSEAEAKHAAERR